MRITARLFKPFVGLGLLATSAHAQSAATYHVAPDTLRYVMDNPYRLYWLKGTDTIGPPQRERSVEAHVWMGTRTRPEVVVRSLTLDVNRTVKTDTFTLTPRGRVEAVNHRPATSAQRVDLLLTLPTDPLHAGLQWADTVRKDGLDAAGKQWYEVARSYRVRRLFDTLGVPGVAEITATGDIQYRFGFWADSSAGRAAWIDVRGPVRERYLFDVANGILLRREWEMDLKGRGVAPAGPDTVPAGLRSRETLILTRAPSASFLLAPLPGKDSSLTVNVKTSGLILLHTVARENDVVTSSMVRNDGMVGVASLHHDGNVFRGYDATWFDTSGVLVSQRVTQDSRGIVLSRDGRDTTMGTPPAELWGVADYAMHELLAPMLLAVPRDGEPHPISILRPVARHWDSGAAIAQDRGGVVLIVLRFGEKKDLETVVLTPEGDLLFTENGGPTGARRVVVSAALQSRLQAALPALKGEK